MSGDLQILLELGDSMWLYDKLISTLAYPTICCCMFYGMVFSLAMIINLLMRAEVRTPRNNQGDGGSAA